MCILSVSYMCAAIGVIINDDDIKSKAYDNATHILVCQGKTTWCRTSPQQIQV